jgi:uncharacterized protein YdiU (UPF0061 family)
VRFGHFEHFFHRGQKDEVRQLADYVIGEYFPETAGDYAGWFGEVVKRTAEMIAQWQAVGFAHGVMNTDNMSILGLTIDYGPYGFLDAYNPQFVCNHSDEQGRYSFINQPGIAHWNLRALALALSDLISTDVLLEKLTGYQEHFASKYRALMRAKLGFAREEEGDDKMIGELLALMATARADYTLSFRNLTGEGQSWLACLARWSSRRRLGWRAIAPVRKGRTYRAWTGSIPAMSCATGWRRRRSARWKTKAMSPSWTASSIFFARPSKSTRATRPSPPRRRPKCAIWK